MILLRNVLSEILNENPDTVETGQGTVSWRKSGAITFIYSDKYEVYFDSETFYTTHVGMMKLLSQLENEDSFNQRKTDNSNVYSFYDFDDDVIVKIRIIGEKSNVLKYVNRVAKKYKNDDNKKDIRPNVQACGYLGRAWPSDGVISFWAFSWWLHAMVKDGILDKIVGLIGLRKDGLMVDMGDSIRAIPYEDIMKKILPDKMSSAKAKELMAKQHLDPDAKKALQGDEYVDAHYKKLAQGSDFAAVANAKKMQSDSIINHKPTI